MHHSESEVPNVMQKRQICIQINSIESLRVNRLFSRKSWLSSFSARLDWWLSQLVFIEEVTESIDFNRLVWLNQFNLLRLDVWLSMSWIYIRTWDGTRFATSVKSPFDELISLQSCSYHCHITALIARSETDIWEGRYVLIKCCFWHILVLRLRHFSHRKPRAP